LPIKELSIYLASIYKLIIDYNLKKIDNLVWFY